MAKLTCVRKVLQPVFKDSYKDFLRVNGHDVEKVLTDSTFATMTIPSESTVVTNIVNAVQNAALKEFDARVPKAINSFSHLSDAEKKIAIELHRGGLEALVRDFASKCLSEGSSKGAMRARMKLPSMSPQASNGGTATVESDEVDI